MNAKEMRLTSAREINASVADWAPGSQAAAAAAAQLSKRHEAARSVCAQMAAQTLGTGGWCLGRMAKDALFGIERTIQLPTGRSYHMPASHVEADVLIIDGLVQLLRLGRRHSLSVNDFGGDDALA